MDLLNILPNIWPLISLFKISSLPKEINEHDENVENKENVRKKFHCRPLKT